MKLEGIHHITAITENAQRNVDFYAGVMGLRLVKKTVNQDSPTVYHLFFADEDGDPGGDLTFFEYPGTPVGRAGAGMVHRIVWRVGGPAALDFWEGRLGAHGIETRREGGSLHFSDPEGLDHELFVADVPDAPLVADHPEVPKELALQGFHAVRAYAAAPDTSTRLLEALEFEPTEDILREVVVSKRPGTLVIGFAAETENLLEHGRDKLLRKGADAIVLNDVSKPGLGFDSDRNAATFLTTRTSIELPEMTKHQLASRILDEVMALRRPASLVAETGLVSSNSKLQD